MDWLTVQQASDETGFSPAEIRALAKVGVLETGIQHINARVLGARRNQLLISKTSLDEHLERIGMKSDGEGNSNGHAKEKPKPRPASTAARMLSLRKLVAHFEVDTKNMTLDQLKEYEKERGFSKLPQGIAYKEHRGDDVKLRDALIDEVKAATGATWS